MNQNILSFQGEFRWLSNFWPADVCLEGVHYDTVENAYQAAKCWNIADRLPFQTDTPGQAKRRGHAIQVREDWEEIKLQVMSDLVFQKFNNNQELRKKLLDTETCIIIEGNTWNDRFWGVCRGRGENHLGRIIMQTRTAIRAQDRI